MRKNLAIISTMLVFSVLTNMVLVYLTLNTHRQKIGYLEADQGIVDLVISDYAKETQSSVTDAIRGRFPVVIYLDDRKCVELKLEKEYIGFSPVYCFSRATGALIYKRLRQM